MRLADRHDRRIRRTYRIAVTHHTASARETIRFLSIEDDLSMWFHDASQILMFKAPTPDAPLSEAPPSLRQKSDSLRIAAWHTPVFACLALSFALTACKRDSPAAPPANASATPAPATTVPAVQPLLSAPAAQSDPPAPATVLTAIYGENADGGSKTLADGREAGFWYGYRYRSDGQERYTAFAFAAPSNDSGFPAPDERVALARITYTLDNGAWHADAVQTDVGEFGALGRAPEPDASREVVTHEVSAERALLAVPTTFFATGATIAGYELFAFETKDGRWRFLGSVKTGEDHSANCADGPSAPDTACVRNAGALRFEAGQDGAMPAIVVARSGSTRGEDGSIRALTSADASTYRHDAASGRYLAPDAADR
jgi:hypothetical protein